jgi:hypothetical protein
MHSCWTRDKCLAPTDDDSVEPACEARGELIAIFLLLQGTVHSVSTVLPFLTELIAIFLLLQGIVSSIAVYAFSQPSAYDSAGGGGGGGNGGNGNSGGHGSGGGTDASHKHWDKLHRAVDMSHNYSQPGTPPGTGSAPLGVTSGGDRYY